MPIPVFIFEVHIYLADQTDVFITTNAAARTEEDAIHRARMDLMNAWPIFVDLIEMTPASAHLVRQAERFGTPRRPQVAAPPAYKSKSKTAPTANRSKA
jgi:hypothetical protein